MTERILTPSKITAWLDCAAYLDLKHQVEEGVREAPGAALSSFARLLMDKGLAHETACLEDYEARGLRLRRVPERGRRETFAAWAERVGGVLHEDDWDVLYQVPLVHDGIRGVADFVLRVVQDDGSVALEPVDSKLAREEVKPGHVLHLAFYADALAGATGVRPMRIHLWLGSGTVETLLTQDFTTYWRRLRGRLARVLELDVVTGTAVPEPCDHCAFCEFADVCQARAHLRRTGTTPQPRHLGGPPGQGHAVFTSLGREEMITRRRRGGGRSDLEPDSAAWTAAIRCPA